MKDEITFTTQNCSVWFTLNTGSALYKWSCAQDTSFYIPLWAAASVDYLKTFAWSGQDWTSCSVIRKQQIKCFFFPFCKKYHHNTKQQCFSVKIIICVLPEP